MGIISCLAGLLIGGAGAASWTFIGILNDVPREGVHTFSSDATLVVISAVIASPLGAIAGAIIGVATGMIAARR